MSAKLLSLLVLGLICTIQAVEHPAGTFVARIRIRSADENEDSSPFSRFSSFHPRQVLRFSIQAPSEEEQDRPEVPFADFGSVIESVLDHKFNHELPSLFGPGFHFNSGFDTPQPFSSLLGPGFESPSAVIITSSSSPLSNSEVSPFQGLQNALQRMRMRLRRLIKNRSKARRYDDEDDGEEDESKDAEVAESIHKKLGGPKAKKSEEAKAAPALPAPAAPAAPAPATSTKDSAKSTAAATKAAAPSKKDTPVLPAAGVAQAAGAAAADDMKKHPCRADTVKFCSEEANTGSYLKALACLKKHRMDLSPSCEAKMKDCPAFQCSSDTVTLCPSAKTVSEVAQCLKQHAKQLSPPCLYAIKEHKKSTMSTPAMAEVRRNIIRGSEKAFAHVPVLPVILLVVFLFFALFLAGLMHYRTRQAAKVEMTINSDHSDFQSRITPMPPAAEREPIVIP